MREDGAFDRARQVAVRTMSTDAWKEDVRQEDATLVRHIRQMTRINRLGMITENFQAGRAYTYASRTGDARPKKAVERAYCVGFVAAGVADDVIDEMTRTDKYVARMVLDASAIARFGTITVACERAEKPELWAHIAGSPELRKCNYGKWIYADSAGADAGRAHARGGKKTRAAIGPYLESPVPDDAVCLLCVDLKWGRRADGPNGLFTQLEGALTAVRRGVGGENFEILKF